MRLLQALGWRGIQTILSSSGRVSAGLLGKKANMGAGCGSERSPCVLIAGTGGAEE